MQPILIGIGLRCVRLKRTRLKRMRLWLSILNAKRFRRIELKVISVIIRWTNLLVLRLRKLMLPWKRMACLIVNSIKLMLSWSRFFVRPLMMAWLIEILAMLLLVLRSLNKMPISARRDIWRLSRRGICRRFCLSKNRMGVLLQLGLPSPQECEEARF